MDLPPDVLQHVASFLPGHVCRPLVLPIPHHPGLPIYVSHVCYYATKESMTRGQHMRGYVDARDLIGPNNTIDPTSAVPFWLSERLEAELERTPGRTLEEDDVRRVLKVHGFDPTVDFSQTREFYIPPPRIGYEWHASETYSIRFSARTSRRETVYALCMTNRAMRTLVTTAPAPA